MEAFAFRKMHGLGNDFVVIDARRHAVPLGHRLVQAITDRHVGVGCDQLIRLDPVEGADAEMHVWNSDGAPTTACGNGARCVARLLMDDLGADRIVLRAGDRVLRCADAGSGDVAVDMGPPDFRWQGVPLAREADTATLDLGEPGLGKATALSVGNPHAVFVVPDVAKVDVAGIGARLEHHPLFPARVNVGFAQVLDRGRVRLRVWERGAGLTQACGTGACAAFAALRLHGLVDEAATMVLDGGTLRMQARPDGHLVMTGPTATAFTGTFAPNGLA
jgi:diaminopimelate epimerase